MITPRKIALKKALATYYVAPRSLLQEATGETNDRVVRKDLQSLVSDGLINRTKMEVWGPGASDAPTPVYYPSRKGLEFLAAETGDSSFMDRCCLCPTWQNLLHWVTVSRFHLTLDQSAALDQTGCVGGWYGEWDVVNPDAKEPHDRYRLYTLLSEKPKRLVCAPDAAFLLCSGDLRWVCYLEMDRGTSGIAQIAASKTPGFAALAERLVHKWHFDTNSREFRVLSVSYTPGRRDMLADAIKEKPGADLWRFASWTDLSPQSLLYAPVWHRCPRKEGSSWVVPPAGPLVVSKAGSVGGPAVVHPGPTAAAAKK